MVSPIRIRIHKKTLVPTKRQLVHRYRSDWKYLAEISYEKSREVFKVVDGTGLVSNDAQFAKLLFDNFGAGEYMCLAWKKKHQGFWNFMKVICYDNGLFKRTEKTISNEQREARAQNIDYKRLKRQLLTAESESEKESIVQELQSVESMMSINKEIVQLDSLNRKGPWPYLKTVPQIYREHEYEEYKLVNKHEDIADQSMW